MTRPRPNNKFSVAPAIGQACFVNYICAGRAICYCPLLIAIVMLLPPVSSTMAIHGVPLSFLLFTCFPCFFVISQNKKKSLARSPRKRKPHTIRLLGFAAKRYKIIHAQPFPVERTRSDRLHAPVSIFPQSNVPIGLCSFRSKGRDNQMQIVKRKLRLKYN